MLFLEPNPDSPANPEAAKLFVENPQAYEEKIKKLVEKTWVCNIPEEHLEEEEEDEMEEE